MKRFHYFNPGHETAVFRRSVNFTPSRNVFKMMNDLACLPAWYAEEADIIFTGESAPLLTSIQTLTPAVSFLSIKDLNRQKEILPFLKASPWGISPDIIHRMKQLKEMTGINLEIPEWKEDYYILTGRQTAAFCLGKIKENLPSVSFPAIPYFSNNIEDIQEYMQRDIKTFIIKTPYSSSGRGLLWITGKQPTVKEREWIKGAISKQGNVSIEPALEKIKDFGWEFFSDGKGTVRYIGISPFETNEKGSFTGTLVCSQKQIKENLFQFIPSSLYEQVLEILTGVLEEIYGSVYEGCIGVDSIIYKNEQEKYLLHPCVEINMRYTMGYLSLQLAKIIHPDSMGRFKITYDKSPAICYANHQNMIESHPIEFKEGKISKGYLSLCPVTPETNYKAILIVE